jgi:hypothetical protein
MRDTPTARDPIEAIPVTVHECHRSAATPRAKCELRCIESFNTEIEGEVSMAAYVLFDVVSVHPERMTGYRDKALASVKAFDGRLVAAPDNIDCREGAWHPYLSN